MMRKLSKIKKLTALCILGSGLATGSASAVTCGVNGASLQGILDGITTVGASSVDVTTDCLADATDSNWSITGSGLSGTTMIIELAGQAGTNKFGVYDTSNSSNSVQLFDGSAGAGTQVVMSIKLDGSVFLNVVSDTGVNFAGNNFGYYLETINGTFFSNTSLNTDNTDHLLAYQGTGDTVSIGGNAAGPWTPNEHVLAWEDLPGGGDLDYNDMVLMVESVVPTVVPVPAAVWLFGTGLLGLVGVARRRA